MLLAILIAILVIALVVGAVRFRRKNHTVASGQATAISIA
jgi:hypothetical protein